MKDDKETKKKLLACAKTEFFEKGYMNASLRCICKDAGVTTGALYFSFRDKEELFDAIVKETVDGIFKISMEHYDLELSEAKSSTSSELDLSDDLQHSMKIVHYMYQHYDEVQLLLTKSQGSRYENIVDRFVDATEKHYRNLANQITKAAGRANFDDYFIHWMSHMQVDVFVHLLTHEKDEKKAEHYIKETVDYLVAGWYGLLEKH